MILGASAYAGVELSGRERPGVAHPFTPSLRNNNSPTALWGYASWGGARWAYPFVPTIVPGFIFVDWSGGFYSSDGIMSGGFFG